MALLKLKSWKLFLLMLTPALLGAVSLLSSQYRQSVNAPLLVFGQVCTFLFLGVFVVWIDRLGTQLVQLPPNQGFNLSPFKWALIASTGYRLALDTYQLWFSLLNHVPLRLEENLWVIPFHLLATFAALYCFYTDAYLLVSAEKKHPGRFSAVWKTFGLILAFPLGLWFIQPRFQTLVARR